MFKLIFVSRLQFPWAFKAHLELLTNVQKKTLSCAYASWCNGLNCWNKKKLDNSREDIYELIIFLNLNNQTSGQPENPYLHYIFHRLVRIIKKLSSFIFFLFSIFSWLILLEFNSFFRVNTQNSNIRITWQRKK